MSKEQKIWAALKCNNRCDAIVIVRQVLETEHSEAEAYACHLVLVILYMETGFELGARDYLCLLYRSPRESPFCAEAAFLGMILQERFDGIAHAGKKRDLMRTLFKGFDKTCPGYHSLVQIMFDSELAHGAPDKAIEIALTTGVPIFSHTLVEAYFAACRVDELWKFIWRNFSLDDDDARASAAMTEGLVWLKLRNPNQARMILESVVRSEYHEKGMERRTYQALQKSYQMLATERYVNGSPEDRFRACAECKTIIDRQPLLAKDEDFLVCGGCRNVPFCSEKCHDAHWPAHQLECGKSQLPKKRIDIFARDMCAECLCGGAQLQCTQCKAMRYCDAKCQKAHWKIHKTKCVP